MARDNELWHAAVRGVRPLAARKTAARPEASAPPRVVPPASGSPMLDRRSFARGGETAIEARLDLHGLTQAEAHRALTRFVERAAREGLRDLLVITGKGRAGEGILREAVPRWLAEPGLRARLVAATPAGPKHGGGGALYLRLKRAR